MNVGHQAALTRWTDDLEEQLLASVSLDEPWALVERFAALVRESGSEDERIAARYIVDRLQAFGIAHTLYEPELFLSVPRRARLEVEAAGERRQIRAKTPSFSVSTGDEPLRGEIVYVPTGQPQKVLEAGTVGDLPADLAGKIVLTEGMPLPGKVDLLARQGVAALIFIAPGTYIHEAICTPIWGAPDLHNAGRQPRIPVIGINRPDGEWLADRCRDGAVPASINTWLDEGWMKCPLVEAVIPGVEEPEKFVLLHGHIDSWHVGVGDNATGDATLLEVARVLHQYRHRLKRTVKICWWPGHSTGRYAGSTWYADTFALDLEANCVVHINCDSPGCRDATAYEDITWMPEAEDIARAAIEAATGQEATGEWPLRAGDISFNNLGISTFFMLLSSIPAEERRRRGLYSVGGCGMNIEWHTEDDTLQIADPEILLKDIRVYLSGVYRAANAPVIPLDYRKTVDALTGHLSSYAQAADGRVDFGPALEAAARARDALDRLYGRAAELVAAGAGAGDPRLKAVNDGLLRAGRYLVAVGFSEYGKFRQDPALVIPPIPAVAPAQGLASLPAGSHEDRVTRVHVTRGLNHVAWSFHQARREAELALQGV